MYAKQERVPWQESNLSEIGSELDKKIREAAAEHEAAWNDLGQEAMLKVWRMEQFQVVEWPSSKHGRFHVGDSYLVLNSHEENDKLIHDVHIWIGAESSQDEYGTAAYKMVELDDSLGGVAIQHREVQGHESELFKSYFGTIMSLRGGVESGFTHVEPTVEEPHLYRIKGTEKSMRLTQMPVERASLNSGDCFILMLSPEQVFLWNGADVSSMLLLYSLVVITCRHSSLTLLFILLPLSRIRMNAFVPTRWPKVFVRKARSLCWIKVPVTTSRWKIFGLYWVVMKMTFFLPQKVMMT